MPRRSGNRVRPPMNRRVVHAALSVAILLLAALCTAAEQPAHRAGTPQRCEPMPKVVHAEWPQYPARESRVAVEGSVTLQFTIKRDGSVSQPTVIANDPAHTADWFNEPALKAIAKSKFQHVRRPCVGRFRIVFLVRD